MKASLSFSPFEINFSSFFSSLSFFIIFSCWCGKWNCEKPQTKRKIQIMVKWLIFWYLLVGRTDLRILYKYLIFLFRSVRPMCEERTNRKDDHGMHWNGIKKGIWKTKMPIQMKAVWKIIRWKEMWYLSNEFKWTFSLFSLLIPHVRFLPSMPACIRRKTISSELLSHML